MRSSPATGGNGRALTAWARARNRWTIASASNPSPMPDATVANRRGTRGQGSRKTLVVPVAWVFDGTGLVATV